MLSPIQTEIWKFCKKKYLALGKKSSKCPNQIIFFVVTPIRSVDWVIHKRAAFSFKDLITLASSFNIDIYTCSHLQSPLKCVYWPSDKWGGMSFHPEISFSHTDRELSCNGKMLPMGMTFPQVPPLLHYHQFEEIVILGIKLIKLISNGRLPSPVDNC